MRVRVVISILWPGVYATLVVMYLVMIGRRGMLVTSWVRFLGLFSIWWKLLLVIMSRLMTLTTGDSVRTIYLFMVRVRLVGKVLVQVTSSIVLGIGLGMLRKMASN